MISVIVPIYNVEKYIVGCLESIINQNYKDFELLLINDGSTDNSISMANNYLEGKKINYRIINKENDGQASARNVGLEQAKGLYICFIDSDDCVSKDFLETLVSNIGEGYDFTFCNFKYSSKQFIDSDNNERTQDFTQQELLDNFLKRKINFVIPSMLFRKDFLIDNSLFFDENIKFSEDQLYIWDVILHSNHTKYYYKTMYGYYLRENSIMTASPINKIRTGYFEYEKHIDSIFDNYPEYKEIKKFIMPRWKLGTLYTSSRILSYDEYHELYKLFDGKTLLKQLKGFNEIKANSLAFISSISSKLLFALCNRMNLNK